MNLRAMLRQRPALLVGGFILAACLLSASPITDRQLESDLNRFFDSYQLERPDPIASIDRYEEVRETEYDFKNTAGQTFRIRFVDLRFYVLTKRRARENFIVRTRYFLKEDKWVLLNQAHLSHVQTQEPEVKPPMEKAPEASVVLDLIGTKLKEESSPAVTYYLHKIKVSGKPVFSWDRTYSISRYRFPVQSRVYTVGRVPSDKEFFQCNWVTMVQYNQGSKAWEIHTPDQATGPRAIVRGCVKLFQNTEEKIEDLFPGEGKTTAQSQTPNFLYT